MVQHETISLPFTSKAGCKAKGHAIETLSSKQVEEMMDDEWITMMLEEEEEGRKLGEAKAWTGKEGQFSVEPFFSSFLVGSSVKSASGKE